MQPRRPFHLGPLLILLALAGVDAARAQKVSVCHIPPDNPDNVQVINVSGGALSAHLGHGDAAIPDDLGCTAGVGECVAGGLLQCTPAGVVCDAVPFPPPEETETSCEDGLDNDCDGSSDESDADCIPVCPETSNWLAVITKQIESLESCTVRVEIVSLSTRPVLLVAQSVDTPTDVFLVPDSLNTVCTTRPEHYLCRHNMFFDYETSLSFNGSYALHLEDQCDPTMPSCPLCNIGEEVVEFSLAGTPCDVTEVPAPEAGDVTGTVWSDTNGDGVRDAGEPPLSLASAMVEIYADDDPFDGLPDGPALATGGIDMTDGHYAFTGLDGVYVLRLVGPAGTCPSSGPDSEIDPNTGYTFPFSVLATEPKTVLSGVDMGLTTVCAP